MGAKLFCKPVVRLWQVMMQQPCGCPLLCLPPQLCSAQCVGAGEFLDLMQLVDICAATGFSLIQVGRCC